MAFQHLPVYSCWKDRAPTGGPKLDAYQTEDNFDMKEYGFPSHIGQAFLQTADTLKSVILTRVPGKAVTGLIDALKETKATSPFVPLGLTNAASHTWLPWVISTSSISGRSG